MSSNEGLLNIRLNSNSLSMAFGFCTILLTLVKSMSLFVYFFIFSVKRLLGFLLPLNIK